VLTFHDQRAFALATVIALVPGLILASGDGIGASNSHLVRTQYQHARESAER
jgi:hypothetical protein